MSEKIKKEFNQLKGLKNRAMQKLLRQVDSEILAMSLVDADDGIIKKGLELITDGTAPSLVESILKSKLEKALHDFKVKYESSINAILDIQKDHYPQMIKEKLDASI